MSVVLRNKNAIVRIKRRNLCAAIIAITILITPVAAAQAVEYSNAADVVGSENVRTALDITTEETSPDAGVAADHCLTLLKTVNHVNGPVATVSARNNERASAAALGVVFGVRFALGPKEVLHKKGRRRGAPSARVGVWQLDEKPDTSGYKALAVSDYRRCKNEEALKFLSDWRWSR